MKNILLICSFICSTFICGFAQTTYKVDYVRHNVQCKVCKKTMTIEQPVKIEFYKHGDESKNVSSKIKAAELDKLLNQYVEGSCSGNKQHDYVDVSTSGNTSNTFTYDNSDLDKAGTNAKLMEYSNEHKQLVNSWKSQISKAYTETASADTKYDH